MNVETEVAEHYTSGRLEGAIRNGLAKLGKDPEHLTVDDFGGMDEFHVGGNESTQALAEQMHLKPGMRLLDIGSGIGGPARFFAAKQGCRVDGIDLTEEFVAVAESLSKMVKLDHLVAFQTASALALPFESDTFDGAYMMHVGMNIADKQGVYQQAKRVLKTGGFLMVFDIMRIQDGALQYPLPWSASEQTSFVAPVAEYREALTQAGLRVVHERNRREFSIEVTERSMAQMGQSGPPPLGLHLLMGEKTPLMLKNIMAMMRAGILAPVELLAVTE